MRPTKVLGAICIMAGLAVAFLGGWAAIVLLNLGRRDVAGEAFLIPGLSLFFAGLIMTWVKKSVVRVSDCLMAGAAMAVISWLLLGLESALSIHDHSVADGAFTLVSIGLLVGGVLVWNRAMERRSKQG